jgi:hypothetical protein
VRPVRKDGLTSAELEKAPKSMLYGDEVLKVYDLAVV